MLYCYTKFQNPPLSGSNFTSTSEGQVSTMLLLPIKGK